MKRKDLTVGDIVSVDLSKRGHRKLIEGTIVGFLDGRVWLRAGHSFDAEFDEIVAIVQPAPAINLKNRK